MIFQKAKGKIKKCDDDEEDADKESTGKNLFVVKTKESKKNKFIIVDRKVKEDLKKNIRKIVTHLEPKPKRRLITRSSVEKHLTIKPKKSISKRNKCKGTKKSLPKRQRRKSVVTPHEEKDEDETKKTYGLKKFQIVH